MKCAFCGGDTNETIRKKGVVIIAHTYCAKERMEELNTKDVIQALVDDDIKIYAPARRF